MTREAHTSAKRKKTDETVKRRECHQIIIAFGLQTNRDGDTTRTRKRKNAARTTRVKRSKLKCRLTDDAKTTTTCLVPRAAAVRSENR